MTNGRRGLRGGTGKRVDGVFLGRPNLRVSGIDAAKWTTAAQGEVEWCKTAEQGAERFMAEWIAAEKARAGLRCAVVCPNATERTKERITQSKRTHTGLPIIVD